MYYKITMIVRPKYNQRQSVDAIDEEFRACLDHYGAETMAFEITQGNMIVEKFVREEIYQDETKAKV